MNLNIAIVVIPSLITSIISSIAIRKQTALLYSNRPFKKPKKPKIFQNYLVILFYFPTLSEEIGLRRGSSDQRSLQRSSFQGREEGEGKVEEWEMIAPIYPNFPIYFCYVNERKSMGTVSSKTKDLQLIIFFR